MRSTDSRTSGNTKELYEEKLTEYQGKIHKIDAKLGKVEQADQNFYTTSKYIVVLANKGYDLFKRSEVEEKRLLVNAVLTNLKWNGEKLSYVYKNPFDALVKLGKRLKMGDRRELLNDPDLV